MTPLLESYRADVLPRLMEQRGYGNLLQVPRLQKITVSTGVSTEKDREVFDEAVRVLGEITGQRPVIAKARRSVAGFKLREGQNVGVHLTLRGHRMYDFFYRLVNVALPRVRDFRGLPAKSFDGFGNYSLGLVDQTVFTEINLDKMRNTIGMNVTIVTSAQTNEEGFDLLSLLGMPFEK
jgi:large subunit ribosomal protein L5